MKKYIMFFFPVCMMLFLFSSCGKKVKQATGLVKEFTPNYMILSVDGDDELKLDIYPDLKVKYTNGAVMVNDSVIVTYVSSFRENQAAAVHLIPRKSDPIKIGHDDSKPLLTTDSSSRGDSIQ